VIGHRLDTISHEHFRQVFGGFAVEGINDAAFIFMLLNKTYNAFIRLIVDLGLNLVIKIRPVERRNKISGSLSPRFFTISLCTLGVAAAVSAMMGTSGLMRSIISFSLRYSGLKSCPHSEIQCASSTAKNEMVSERKYSMFSSW
jgi:hypothetical protein